MRSGEFVIPFPRFLVGLPTCARADCAVAHPRDCGFRVAWSINPHMRPGVGDPRAAAREHARFVACLEGLGASVVALPFVHGAYDSVFVKDAALVVTREGHTRALPATFATPERAPETAARRRHLATRGLEIVEPLASPLEGGDIALLPGGGALLGYGFRSSVASTRGLSAFLDEEVVPLRLIDPFLYHLDMVVCPVSPDTMLVCPEALDPGSLALLERRFGPSLVRLTRTEAMAFSANAVRVGRTLVTGGMSARLSAVLADRGFRIVSTPLHEIQRAGGSAACLVSQWHARDHVHVHVGAVHAREAEAEAQAAE